MVLCDFCESQSQMVSHKNKRSVFLQPEVKRTRFEVPEDDGGPGMNYDVAMDVAVFGFDAISFDLEKINLFSSVTSALVRYASLMARLSSTMCVINGLKNIVISAAPSQVFLVTTVCHVPYRMFRRGYAQTVGILFSRTVIRTEKSGEVTVNSSECVNFCLRLLN